jgi:hypothetical protein
VKFKWQSRLIRKSTRAEDLETARRVVTVIRRKLALSYARQVKLKADPAAISALVADFSQLRSRRKRTDSAKRFPLKFQRIRDREFLKELGIDDGDTRRGRDPGAHMGDTSQGHR